MGETFSKSEFFEREGKWAGEYSPRVLSLMRSQAAKILRLTSDPKEQGHYFLDKTWRWHVINSYGSSKLKETMKHLVYHHDSIDFKDTAGVEQLKLARRNSKIPFDKLHQFEEDIIVHDDHYFFTKEGREAFLRWGEAVQLNGNRYYPELLSVEELEDVILPSMPGEDMSERIREFAKLMRLKPLGYIKDTIPYYSTYAEDARDHNVHMYGGTLVDKKGRPSKSKKTQPLATLPHAWYPLKTTSKKAKSHTPYLVSGPKINEVFRLPKDERIATPLRSTLVRVE